MKINDDLDVHEFFQGLEILDLFSIVNTEVESAGNLKPCKNRAHPSHFPLQLKKHYPSTLQRSFRALNSFPLPEFWPLSDRKRQGLAKKYIRRDRGASE